MILFSKFTPKSTIADSLLRCSGLIGGKPLFLLSLSFSLLSLSRDLLRDRPLRRSRERDRRLRSRERERFFRFGDLENLGTCIC